MLSVEKVATPAEAEATFVPRRFAPVVPVAALMAIVMLAVEVVTGLPLLSCTTICAPCVSDTPAVVPVGSTGKAGAEAPPAFPENDELVAPPKPVAFADTVYPAPAFGNEIAENDATPFTAAIVTVPPMLAPAGPLPRPNVTDAVDVVAL